MTHPTMIACDCTCDILYLNLSTQLVFLLMAFHVVVLCGVDDVVASAQCSRCLIFCHIFVLLGLTQLKMIIYDVVLLTNVWCALIVVLMKGDKDTLTLLSLVVQQQHEVFCVVIKCLDVDFAIAYVPPKKHTYWSIELDLGAEPNEEFSTLTLKARIAFLCD